MGNQARNEETLFQAALELNTPEERAAYLAEACGGDPQLRERVEALLQAASQTNDFLEAPAANLVRNGELPQPGPGIVLTVPIAEKPGDRIGHYKLLEQIGEGGCGVVYMAEQTEPIRRRVAFKVIKLGMDTRQVIGRFEAERQALALMDHPNICKVLDAGATETGRPYFVMELVRGIKITDYCDQHSLSTKERLGLFMQVCHAVQHAHQKGIIHRDLKPSNILVTLHDGVPVPKVIDFGIAKATQQPLTDKTLFTAFQQFIGTPAYMSPEQAEMSGLDIDTRSDIYALGVLLYELLTGKPPFEPETLLKAGLDEMRRIIREQEPPKPSTRLATTLAATPHSALSTLRSAATEDGRTPQLKEVQGDLDWIVMKCLEKDRARRYPTADALADDLGRHLTDHLVEARPPTVAYRVRRFVRRNRGLVGGGAFIAGVLLAATALSLYLAFVADQARQAASRQRDKARQAEGAEAAQRKVAEASVAESRQRLVRLDVASGIRALDEGDSFGSLLWFAEALRLEPTNSTGAALHRLRLGTTLGHLPPLTQMWFHQQPVNTVFFNADGRWAVTTGEDGAQIRETATGQPVGALLPHLASWIVPTMSTDGRRLLTVSDHRAVHVWDAATGRPITAPMEHRLPIRCAALSPDGRRVFTACYLPWNEQAPDGAEECDILIWDADTGRPMRQPLKWRDSVHHLVLSRKGDKLAVVGSRGFAAVWDLSSPRALQFHESPATEARIVPGLELRAGATNESLESHLPDIPGDGKKRWLPEGSPEARSVAFDPNGQRVVFACADGTAQVWSLASGKRTRVLGQTAGGASQPESGLRRAVFSPDNLRVMTVGNDGSVRFWDAANGRPLSQLQQKTGRPDRAGFSPDGRWVVTVGTEGRFGEARVWDVATGEPLSPSLVHAGEVVANFSPDGASLLTAGADHTARLWSLVGGRPAIGPLQHSWERVKTEGIATGQHEPTRLEESWLEDDSSVTWAAFSSNGQRVVTVSYNGSARVWETATGAAVTNFARMSLPLEYAAFSPDGSRFATIGGRFFPKDGEGRYRRYASDPHGAREAGVACVWDARSGQPVTPVVQLDQVPRWTEFSPDGRWLIARSRRGAGVWDARTGLPVTLAMQPAAPLRAIAFSRDGRRLAACRVGVKPPGETAGRPETQVYEAQTSRPITPPLPDVAEVAALEFSPDGRWLVTVESDPNADDLKSAAGYAATVRIWDAATGRAVSTLPQVQGNPMLWPRRPNDFYPKTVFSQDSARLTILVTDGIGLAWDIASGRALDPVRLADQRAVIKAFNRDGKRLASLRGERTLQVWDATCGEPLTPPMETAIHVDTVHFSPDGSRLLAVGDDGAELWPLSTEVRSAEAVMQHAQLLSGRQFDASGSITPAAPEILTNLWHAMRTKLAADFEVTPAQMRTWHERAVESCQKQEQWFAMAFHLDQLLKDRPDDNSLRLRRNEARRKAALEHLNRTR